MPKGVVFSFLFFSFLFFSFLFFSFLFFSSMTLHGQPQAASVRQLKHGLQVRAQAMKQLLQDIS